MRQNFWRQPASAPKTGARILGSMGDGASRPELAIVFWSVEREMWCENDGGWGSNRYLLDELQAWAPLPRPPIKCSKKAHELSKGIEK